MAGVLLVLLYFGMALLAAVIIMQPDRFNVTRSAVVHAPPDRVFARINDLRAWENWSPWAKLDPNAQNSYEGPESGPGALMRWSGNDKVGAGSLTITGSTPPEAVAMKLEMQKPSNAASDVYFQLAPEPEGATQVTWTMTGRRGLVAKALNLVLGFDRKIGARFEEGLANLDRGFAAS
jgi:hypothetical protein